MRTLTVSQLEAEVRSHIAGKKSSKKFFSIRNQALIWGVAPSTLQKLIKGERGLGFHVASHLAHFFDAKIEKQKLPKHRRKPRWSMGLLNPNSPHQIKWIHLTILEMLKLSDFEPSTAWVASRLGLSESVVKKLLLTMEREKMIERSASGWRDCLGDAEVGSTTSTTQTIRETLKTITTLSAQKIDDVPFEKREHACHIFPISKRQMAQVKAKITSFRLELSQTLQNSRASKDDVYVLQIGFFPVTQSLETLS